MRDFLSKKRIVGELIAQRNQQLASPPFVLLAHVRDGQQYSCKRRKILAARGGQLQFGDSLLLVTRNPAQTYQPPYRRRHAANNVLAYARSEMSVEAIRIDRQQLSGPSCCFLYLMQRGDIPLLDQARVVGLESGRHRKREQTVTVF